MLLMKSWQPQDLPRTQKTISATLKAIMAITIILFPLFVAYGWIRLIGRNYNYEPLRLFSIQIHVLFITLGASGMLFQFISRVRRQNPRWHRWIGWLSGGFVLVSMSAGAGTNVLELLSDQKHRLPIGGDLTAAIFNIITGSYIVGCLLGSIYYAHQKKFAIHRRWSIRALGAVMGTWISYRLAFVIVRIVAGQSLIHGSPVMFHIFGHTVSLQGTAASISVVSTVLILEILLQWERIVQASRVTAAALATTRAA